MERIKFHRLTRAIEAEARARGHYGDIFADRDDVPLVGTLRQQLEIAAIGCDAAGGPASTRDRELANRFVRAAVLAKPPYQPKTPVSENPAISRAWRRK